jgi:hypothetical protein
MSGSPETVDAPMTPSVFSEVVIPAMSFHLQGVSRPVEVVVRRSRRVLRMPLILNLFYEINPASGAMSGRIAASRCGYRGQRCDTTDMPR